MEALPEGKDKDMRLKAIQKKENVLKMEDVLNQKALESHMNQDQDQDQDQDESEALSQRRKSLSEMSEGTFEKWEYDVISDYAKTIGVDGKLAEVNLTYNL